MRNNQFPSSSLGEQGAGGDSWLGMVVRDFQGNRGLVIQDYRFPQCKCLRIRMETGITPVLTIYNDYESQADQFGFQWEYRPGEWAFISDNAVRPWYVPE